MGGLIHTDGPLVDKGPDIVVGEPGHRASWQTALGGAPTKLVEDNKSRWSGDHIFDPDLMPGVVLSKIKLEGESFRGIDIAPTILAELGPDRPGYMTWQDLFRSARMD